MTSRAYGTRSPRSHYDVILIVTSFATELVTPTVTDERAYVTEYGHLTAFNNKDTGTGVPAGPIDVSRPRGGGVLRLQQLGRAP